MVNKINKFKKGKNDVEKAQIKKLLAKDIPIKVIPDIISTTKTYK